MKHEAVKDHAERKRLLALIERCEKKQTMSDDLIRRSDALKVLSLYGWTPIDGLYDTLAHDIPPADRPQGEWKSVKASIYPYGYDVECSVCGFRMGSSFGYKYCPNCGAHMKGADDEQVDMHR